MRAFNASIYNFAFSGLPSDINNLTNDLRLTRQGELISQYYKTFNWIFYVFDDLNQARLDQTFNEKYRPRHKDTFFERFRPPSELDRDHTEEIPDEFKKDLLEQASDELQKAYRVQPFFERYTYQSEKNRRYSFLISKQFKLLILTHMEDREITHFDFNILYNMKNPPPPPAREKSEIEIRLEEDLLPLFQLYNLEIRSDYYTRKYPFIAFEVAEDLNQFCKTNTLEIGRLFTGDLSRERDYDLANYVNNNISKRRYECLLLRWTEALAIYENTDLVQNKRTFFRALQVFETCILINSILFKISEEIDKESKNLWLYSICPSHLSLHLSDLESKYFNSPIASSVDADELLAAAYKACHCDSYLSTTRKKLDRLENNKHWVKGQYAIILLILSTLLKFFGMETFQHLRELHLHLKIPLFM